MSPICRLALIALVGTSGCGQSTSTPDDHRVPVKVDSVRESVTLREVAGMRRGGRTVYALRLESNPLPLWLVADWDGRLLSGRFDIPASLPPTRYQSCSASGVGAFNFRTGDPETIAYVPAGAGVVEFELRGDVGAGPLVVCAGRHVALDGIPLLESVPVPALCTNTSDLVTAYSSWAPAGAGPAGGPLIRLELSGDGTCWTVGVLGAD